MVFFPNVIAFMEGLGGPEMILIFVVILMLFGGQKLPEFARGLGKSMREFKKAAAGVEEEFKRAMDEDERKKNTPALLPPTTPGSTLLPPNLYDVPPEALAPVPASETAAPSIDSIPPPPLIPLGGSEATPTVGPATEAAPPAETPAAPVAAISETTPAMPASTPPPAPAAAPTRSRDDYS